MRKATNLDVDQTGKGNHSLAYDALLQLLLGCEDVRLTRIYPRATVLFAEGQPADGVYLLRSGRVKSSISSAAGKTVILRVEQAVALLGVNSVVKDLPHDVTVETIERCRIDFIPRPDFMRLLDKTDPALIGVAHALGNELSDALEHVRSLLLSRSAAEKLARLLLKWCDEQGELGPEGVRVNPGLTHEEIAQMICTSRETVTRLFAELRRKHIVNFADSAMHVRNRKALAHWYRAE